MKHKMYRQGDVLIERVSKLPKGLVKQKPENGRIVLAHGEATFHHHSIEADAADWWKSGDDQFVNVKAKTSLVHQEHAPVEIARGKYRVTRQKEYSPAAIRNVAD